MGTDFGASAHADDYRLADFKLLLPIGPDVRTLVIGTHQPAFLPHLAGELGTIDLVVEPPQDRLHETTLAAMAALAAPERVRRIGAPEGEYDLVFSEDVSAGRHLRAGGVLCRFLGREVDSTSSGLTPIGRWRAYPDWPAFRVLIPDHPAGFRAAARDLRLYPSRSLTGLLARFSAGAAARRLPEQGIALYRREGAEPHPTLLGTLRGALASMGTDAIRETPADHWLLASGRLGPGNPVLAFSLDAHGQPQRLIKAARFPGGQHLRAEAEQLDRIEQALGPTAAARIIRPTDSAVVAGRWALAYDFEPTHPFFGIRWRLQSRKRFCLAMADWLAALGLATRRQPDRTDIAARHVAPLQRLVARRILPRKTQHQAAAALEDLERLAPSLPMILEHGDLGIYNTRLTNADGSDFRVLDWGSSTFEGIPLGDLAYLLCSARAPKALARRCLGNYLVRMHIPTGEAPALWFSYLARRWEELDGIRPPVHDDPTSGGGLLLPIHARVAPYLDGLT
ncbi:phosphotransferase family protein [Thiocapsa marina]|uniref:Uncharacterized protein n=1 Tax=Thiocapsa marina 5811 TaxID=768671 RepID=F9UDP8_9GAMM|nr:phosphotransferase [Thiocapsa marina]EGV17695.1 hypothetical protein ThimaDRAFT_3240 [Thiocapsa marina 5811]